MTPNKISKNNILEMYEKIDIDNLFEEENMNKIMAFHSVILNERECCMHEWYNGSKTKPLTPRNCACYGNVIRAVIDENFKSAWHELIDILTDVHEDELLEIDELIVFSFALEMIIEGMKKCDLNIQNTKN